MTRKIVLPLMLVMMAGYATTPGILGTVSTLKP